MRSDKLFYERGTMRSDKLREKIKDLKSWENLRGRLHPSHPIQADISEFINELKTEIKKLTGGKDES
jgi:hypothetical protein